MPSLVIGADIALYREGLAAALAARTAFAVAGTATSADELLRLVPPLAPDLVLVDRAMPSSLDAITALAASTPTLRTIALGVQDDDDILACARAGIAAYVPRHATLDELIRIMHASLQDELHCSPREAALLLRGLARATVPEPDPDFDPLTQREYDIAHLLARGLANKEIAARLGIEVATVKNHVHAILAKLGVRRRTEAAERLLPHLRLRVAQGLGPH